MNMKIAFVTDIHVRDEEITLHRKLLARTAEAIKGRSPNLVLIGGDLAGWRVPHKASVQERNALVEFVCRLRDDNSAKVVVCRGNHDFPGDYDFLGRLEDVIFVSKPACLQLEGVDLHVWPWLERSEFPPGADYAQELTRAYSATLSEGRRRDVVVAILGHVATANGLLREGQPVLTTDEPLLDFKSIPGMGLVDVGFLGHYHLPQVVYGGRVVYGGSLFYNQFGEEGPRGWSYWEGKHPSTHPPELVPLVQPLRQVLRYRAGEVPLLPPPGENEAGDVNLRKVVVEVPAGGLAEAKAEAQAQVPGSRLEFNVVREDRSREGAVEISAARSSREKLEKWLVTQGVSGPVTQHAFELLEQIEDHISTGGKTL